MKIYWLNPVSDSFFVAADWNTDQVPGNADIAAMTIAGTYTVTDSLNTSVLGITTGASTTFALAGGTTFTATEGTATGANRGQVALGNGSEFNIGGTFDNIGSIAINGSSVTTYLTFLNSAVLDGGGAINMLGDLDYNKINVENTLINVNNTIEGAGVIEGGGMLVNETNGVIDANSPGGILDVLDLVQNSGLMEAADTGILDIYDAVVTNTATGVIYAGANSTVDLHNADILGGTLEAADTGIIDDTDSATLDGSGSHPVTIKGTLQLTDDTDLSLVGVLNNIGTISVQSTGDPTGVIIGTTGQESVTLQGGGHLGLNDTIFDFIKGDTAGSVLNNVNNDISGSGEIDPGLMLNNEKLGIVDATGTIDSFNIVQNTVENAGLVEATGAAGLVLASSEIINSATGVIEAGNGSEVGIFGLGGPPGSMVTGGTLTTVGTGFIYAYNTTLTSLTNAGAVVVDDGLGITLSGSINNTGSISLNSTGDATGITLEGSAVTLKGNGSITLSNSSENYITGASPGGLTQLNNDGNAIYGAGTISNLILDNAKGSLIDANDTPPLIIDTGLNTIVNAGTLQAEFGHELYVGSAVNNTGQLNANGGTIAIAGVVSGSGTASDTGEIEFGAAASTSTKFFSGITAELILDDSAKYTGTISGFGAAQSIDLADINEATATLSLSGGVLTVNDHEGDIAKIKFSGSYVLGDFHIANDGGGGTLLTDPPVDTAPQSIADGAKLEIASGATGTITFAGPTGTLQLDSSWSFSGKVAGFGGQDRIDLADIDFDTQTTLGYAKTGAASGKLTVSDGIHTANISLLGSYMASSFATGSDGHGGTMIAEVTQTSQQPLLTHPHV
jgi:hypothetical protein